MPRCDFCGIDCEITWDGTLWFTEEEIERKSGGDLLWDPPKHCCNCAKDKGWSQRGYNQLGCNLCKQRRLSPQEKREQEEARRQQEERRRQEEERRRKEEEERREQEERRRNDLVNTLMEVAPGLQDPHTARRLLVKNNWQHNLAFREHERLETEKREKREREEREQREKREREERELREAVTKCVEHGQFRYRLSLYQREMLWGVGALSVPICWCSGAFAPLLIVFWMYVFFLPSDLVKGDARRFFEEVDRIQQEREHQVTALMADTDLKDPSAARKLLAKHNWQGALAATELMASEERRREHDRREQAHREAEQQQQVKILMETTGMRDPDAARDLMEKYNWQAGLAASAHTSSQFLAGGPPCQVPAQLVMEWTSNFSDARNIGEGAFGEVFEGIVEDNINQRQVRVAVKRLKPSIRLDGDETEHRAALSSIRREIHVLSTFFHPNIIRLLGFTSPSAGIEKDMCLIYELGQCGSLDKMLVDDKRAEELSWKARVRIAAGVSRALNYLHCHDQRAPAYHRDVKSANIVLDLGLSPKLIDCGLSKFIPNQQRYGTVMSTHGAVLGTPGYMCPFYQRTGTFEAKSEIFSFGIVLLELLTGRVQGYQNSPGNDLYGIYIEDKTTITGDLDARSGTWPPACAAQLEKLTCECLEVHRKRIGTMLAVMRQLVAIEKESCQATPEEMRLNRIAKALQDEVDVLNWENRRNEAACQAAQHTCVICFDEGVMEGVTCPVDRNHFLCRDCFNRDVKDACSADNIASFIQAKQQIPCRMCCAGASAGGVSTCFQISQFVPYLDEDTLLMYLKAREDIAVSQALKTQQYEHDMKIRELEQTVAEMAAGREKKVLLLRKQIIEEILTLKCPRCKLAFLDFDGCFALSCMGCKCGFCAYCLEDCGNDAHRHVANCRYNIAPGKDVFGHARIFERAQKERRTRLLRSFLVDQVETDMRKQVVQALHKDLADLGIESGAMLDAGSV